MTHTPSSFHSIPAKRYKGGRSNILTSAYAGLYEIIMNSFGGTEKEFTLDIPPLKTINIAEHDARIAHADTLRIKNLKKYQQYL